MADVWQNRQSVHTFSEGKARFYRALKETAWTRLYALFLALSATFGFAEKENVKQTTGN